MNIRYFFLYGIILMCSACTTSGQLYYIDTKGNEKLGCDVEFDGIPSVDKYAVEYALSLCAKSIAKNGNRLSETYLLDVNTTIPEAPCDNMWSHELAKKRFRNDELSKKEYGYIVALVDLGLAVLNECR